MKAAPGRKIDRAFVRLIATKRVVSGSLSLLAGCGVLYFAAGHGGKPYGMIAIALVLLFGGGAWSLRDGLRLFRMLRENQTSG